MSLLLKSRWHTVSALVLSLHALGCGPAEETDDADAVVDETDDTTGEGKADGVSSSSSKRLADLPFYFGVPKSAVTVTLDRSKYPYPTIWNASLETADVGMRMIVVKQADTKLATKVAARRDMAKRLAAAGVLKDGDIALTVRFELAKTMAYPHIQMGSTHAGLVYVKDGAAFNIDSPLDNEYVGQFDTMHYAGDGALEAGVMALHILRPRAMTETRRTGLRVWIDALKQHLAAINGTRAQLKFQSDYLSPIYAATSLTTRQTVTLLGKIILEADTQTKLPMYCAEFAWHMVALSNCSADEIRAAPASGAACVSEPFAPMPLLSEAAGQVGLAEGPLLALFKTPAAGRAALAKKIFANGNPSKLSSGHRAVAEAVAPLMGALSQYYDARAAGATVEQASASAKALNANVKPNYSPTAFLAQAMPEGARLVDYVATVVFVNSVGYEKAKKLALNPVP